MTSCNGNKASDKIDLIIEFIYELAGGKLSHRLKRIDETSNNNDLDAIIEGLNMLAEELEATTVSRNRYRESEEKLRISKEQAEQANRAKSHFLSNMSHEIRTPLGAIIGFNQVLIRRAKLLSLPKDIHQYHENIRISALMLSDLTNNVLDLSKIDAGKFECSEEVFNLEDMVANIINTYLFQSDQKNIQLSYEVSPEMPSSIISDRIKIMQILTNLIGNAIKFTPSGKDIKLTAHWESAIITFRVIDQGAGISVDHQKNIFKAFDRGDESTSQKFGGTGLGLTITKKLVDALAGEISVESQLGQGSIFSVSLGNPPLN